MRVGLGREEQVLLRKRMNQFGTGCISEAAGRPASKVSAQPMEGFGAQRRGCVQKPQGTGGI